MEYILANVTNNCPFPEMSNGVYQRHIALTSWLYHDRLFSERGEDTTEQSL